MKVFMLLAAVVVACDGKITMEATVRRSVRPSTSPFARTELGESSRSGSRSESGREMERLNERSRIPVLVRPSTRRSKTTHMEDKANNKRAAIHHTGIPVPVVKRRRTSVYGAPNNGDIRQAGTKDVCKACQDMMKDLRLILNSNQTQTFIEKFLDNKVCSMLGDSSALCQQYVKFYTPVLFQLLETELESIKICSKIGFCSGEQQVLKQPVDLSSMYSTLDFKQVIKDKDTSFGLCFICKMVLERLYKDLGDHATEAQIEAYLDKVCNFMPSAFRSECVSLINEFTPAIIKLVLKKMTPEQICVEIRLCSSKANNTLHNLFYISPVN